MNRIDLRALSAWAGEVCLTCGEEGSGEEGPIPKPCGFCGGDVFPAEVILRCADFVEGSEDA